MPWPPGFVYLEWVKNLGEIIEEGSQGTMVEPEFSGQWGAELLIDGCKDKWTAIEIPKEFQKNVKLRCRSRVDGKDYVVPGSGVGSIVAVSDTAKSAIQDCVDIAGEIKGFGLEIEKESLKKALEEFNKIEFPKEEPVEAPVDEDSLAAILASTQDKSLSGTLSRAMK
jgi:hypothetical protein